MLTGAMDETRKEVEPYPSRVGSMIVVWDRGIDFVSLQADSFVILVELNYPVLIA